MHEVEVHGYQCRPFSGHEGDLRCRRCARTQNLLNDYMDNPYARGDDIATSQPILHGDIYVVRANVKSAPEVARLPFQNLTWSIGRDRKVIDLSPVRI